MAYKPQLPYKRNPIQNAATQAKLGEWPTQKENAATRARYAPNTTVIENSGKLGVKK